MSDGRRGQGREEKAQTVCRWVGCVNTVGVVRSSTSWAMPGVEVVFGGGERCGAAPWPETARLWPCLASRLSSRLSPFSQLFLLHEHPQSSQSHAHRTHHRKAQEAPLARPLHVSRPWHSMRILLLVRLLFFFSGNIILIRPYRYNVHLKRGKFMVQNRGMQFNCFTSLI